MSEALVRAVRDTIRDVPDFPKPGIMFKDITPVLASPRLLQDVVNWVAGRYAGQAVDAVVGMESRGFIFGAAVAPQLHAGFIPARKPGKLPWDKESIEYDLEYGSAILEIHKDAIQPGQRIVIVDDLAGHGRNGRGDRGSRASSRRRGGVLLLHGGTEFPQRPRQVGRAGGLPARLLIFRRWREHASELLPRHLDCAF